jgi:hypothetical protein
MASLGIAMGTWLRKAYSCGRGERMVAALQAVFFDLYETLITEFDPDWTPSPSTADQLGVDAALFERETRRCSVLQFRAVASPRSSGAALRACPAR